jgi:cell division protein FtsB
MRANLIVVIPLVLVLVLAGTVMSMFPFREQSALATNIAATQTELATIQFQNAQLEAEAEALGGPAEIEKVAREELGYVFPGETPYVVVGTRAADEPVLDSTPLSPAAPWYSRIIDFFTGSDLSADA